MVVVWWLRNSYTMQIFCEARLVCVNIPHLFGRFEFGDSFGNLDGDVISGNVQTRKELE